MNTDPTSLGLMAIYLADVAPGDLRRAVAYQKEHSEMRLGEVLVKLDVLKPAQVDTLLARQTAIRDKQPTDAEVIAISQYATHLATKQTQRLELLRDILKRHQKT